jgi:hypothetical protein
MMGPIRYAAQKARGIDDVQRGAQSHNFAIRNNIADVQGCPRRPRRASGGLPCATIIASSD